MDGEAVFWIVALMFAFFGGFIGYAMGYEKGRQDYRKYILLHFELSDGGLRAGGNMTIRRCE